MKVIILCGDEGTRLKEETEFKPKPLSKVVKWPERYFLNADSF